MHFDLSASLSNSFIPFSHNSCIALKNNPHWSAISLFHTELFLFQFYVGLFLIFIYYTYIYIRVYIYFSHVISMLQFAQTNQSTSVLTLTPTAEDDGKYLACRCANPHIENSVIEDKYIMAVHCKLFFFCI